MIDSGVDLAYPVFEEVELAIDDARREASLSGGSEQVSAGSLAHQLVTAALASRDYGRAEHAARVARELLPGDETAALDLARVLDAQGLVEQARAVLESFAHRDRIAPVTEERE
jgi:Flp pilus assembly protein TadD